jgi:hypothetical protein
LKTTPLSCTSLSLSKYIFTFAQNPSVSISLSFFNFRSSTFADITNYNDPSAYPFAAMLYLLLPPTESSNCTRTRELWKFFHWTLFSNASQDTAQDSGYVFFSFSLSLLLLLLLLLLNQKSAKVKTKRISNFESILSCDLVKIHSFISFTFGGFGAANATVIEILANFTCNGGSLLHCTRETTNFHSLLCIRHSQFKNLNERYQFDMLFCSG